jgi:hypothetical protein
MRCANDNRPPRGAAVRFRDTAIAVIVILLIAGATGSFNVQAANVQAAGTGPAHNSIQVPGA